MSVRFLITPLVLAALHCGSLLNELDRIERLANPPVTNAPPITPTVIATDPADNTFASHTQTYFDVTYSAAINPSSISVQANFGACSGNLQVSYDGFTNCLGGTLDTSGNPRIRFTPTVMLRGIGLQLRTLSGITSSVGVAATPYTMATGFRIGAPCGGQNCFFSYSTPLMATAGGGSGIFLVRSGVNAGKYIVYSITGTTTTLIDPVNGTSGPGPGLGGCFTPAVGAHSFYVSSGTHAGKELLIRSGASVATCWYDPVSAIFTAAGAPTLPGTANAGGLSIQPESGPDFGNTLIFRGGGTDLWRYNAVGGGITDTGQDTAINVSGNSHYVRMATGSFPGQYLVYSANGTAATSFLDTAGPTISANSNTNGTVGNGGLSFEVTTGVLAGRVITGIGSNTNGTSLFNTSAFALGTAGPNFVGGNLTNGGLLLKQTGTISENYPLILLGDQAGTTDYLSNIFNPSSGTFGAGPVTTGPINTGASSIWVPSATGVSGGFLIVNGSTTSTSIYLPHNNSFHGSRMPTDVPNIGSSAYQITGGINDGKTLIVGGNLTSETALYDPLSHEMSRGPSTTLGGSLTSFGIKIEQGTQANKILVFYAGGANTFNVYDPATNLFSVPGGWPTSGSFTNKAAGGVAFMNATNTKIVIVNGASNGVETLDQLTGIAAGATNLTCIANTAPLAVPYSVLSTGQARQLVYCQTNQFSIYDHLTETFTATVNSVAPAGLGVKAFVISGGAENGKVLILHGNNLLTTSLLNPETNSVVAGPLMPSGCGVSGVGDGSQVLPLTTGVNKGKVLVVTGNGQSTTCMYDPATHSFAQGPSISSTPSPGFQIAAGSQAFRTNGGLYPTAFILVSGTSRNVWSTYVP